MAATPFSLEGLFAYISETFAAGVIQSYQGQGLLDDAPLLQRQDPLEDFKKFNRNDQVFQEYDSPSGDDSKMGWKRSRPPTWRLSLWKAMKHAFYIQILGGVALGSLAIVILVIDFNTVDLCYDMQSKNWTALPKRIQAVMVTAATTEAYYVQLWTFLVVLTMFGWRLIKELNLLILNLLGAFFDTCYRLYLQVYDIYNKPWRSFPLNGLFVFLLLMNSLIIGRDIAKKSEVERNKRIKKAIKVSSMLVAQFAFGIPITFGLVYVLIPLVTAAPKVIVRLAAQRIDFLHPGDSHVLLNVLYSASAIVFRVMQAELNSLRLFILLSFAHGAIDLLERLTIVIRDYFWYFVYKKLKKESETILKASQFRSPRSMRFVADMSIQMILGESTSLIAAVGFIQLYNFMYNRSDASSASTNMVYITQFFIRVSIAISIDFVFNSFSFWLQMSYLNIAVVRVWRKKWRKHMLIAFILTAVTLCYFTTHLFAVVKDKNTSGVIIDDHSCKGPFSKF
ncbi:uncharacterized protein [Porites lutea]|uniref:uncharacterized protein isoform X2 n=1 Tax=Porites lutea TaxID=51062 RepID=UPI003CC53E23